MPKQIPVTLFHLFVLIMIPFAGKAQTDSAAYEVFIRDICRAPRMSAAYQYYGQPFELTMVYTISKGKKTVHYFPENIPGVIRADLRECERILKGTKWDVIFPALKAEEDFSIIVPMVFRFEDAPGITKREETVTIERLFDFTHKIDPPYQICGLLFINFFKQTR